MKKSHVLLIVVFFGLTLVLSACVPGPRVTGTPGVALSDEMVFVAYGNFVYGLDVTTGSVLWHYPEKANNKIVFFAPPLVVGDYVYVGDLENNFHKLNIDNGSVEWTFSEANGYYIGQAAEADGVVYAPCNDGTLYAIDEDGKLKWGFETGHYIWAQPQVTDDAVYIASMDHYVYAVSLSGEELWSKKMEGAVVGSSLLNEDGSILFVGSIAGEMVALDTSDGETVWSIEVEEGVWGKPLLFDSTLYIADSGGNIYALNPEDGKAKWQTEYDGSVVGGLVALEDGFALATNEGVVKTYSFDGTPKWESTPGGEIVQAPAINDEYLVVGTIGSDNLVYSFNVAGVQLWSTTPED